ncbi:3-oxoacyl-[acyl-carrier-protein] synthase-3 [Pseudogulbenkiania subflava DSM 22618]|uniref:Beta-ketoacyl-[acyl-carrier-protein] synthase III n=2 Tax=Pseudogulbenkiania subflava TaxID=451637 RepID=A0A1Y6BZ66_9NEIS|nr:3-oxoacyl-[acyl-carrier-protein] synthase-3 [Pseudogulbenkiania subflava DSM 22618]SMF32960.1 3-oxoacyl-[acyl-carrier-protein] synthase-3 [Pseudogulbenkiania subflava DSM 22618]SMF47933.1 3-oxoacyl-[acyl-carrier-protein] synthase-3 [Pseudogulbenkiania subflava DSM 22618]
MFACITGVGSYLPGQPVSNYSLIRRGIDTTDEWIVSRTGIKSRHLAEIGCTSSDLALEASHRALLSAGIHSGELDLIILATSTPDFIFPSTACLLQAKLGNHGAMAFDVQAVCSGFVYALSIAEKFIRSGSHKKVLVVGAEVFSRTLDWEDRATCVLFGDGAGAVVLEASENPGIIATASHADGSYHKILSAPGNVSNGKIIGDPFLRMDGPAVFKFAVNALADVAIECLEMAGLSSIDVDWLIPHQANTRIIESTAKKLGLPMENVIVTVDRHGNTSSASIPLALDVAVRDGRIQRGQKVMFVGVGGGFTWGAVLLEF